MSTPAIFAPEGRLDATNASEAEAQMQRLLDAGPPGLIVDLSHLDYLSSAGLRALLRIAETARRQASPMALACASPAIGRVLLVSGFDRLIPMTETLAEARELFRRAGGTPG